MAVFKVNKTSDYSVMCNSHLRESKMSLKAKGVLSIMLSLPDNWDYSITGLATLSKDGKDSVIGALKELEQFGYLIRTRRINDKGQFDGYNYDIYEKPYTENPNTENQGQSNTNVISIKELKDIAKRVLDYLNEKAGTHYKAIDSNLKFITARLKDYSEIELKAVIDKKVKEWKGTEMEKYLRPETLFNATKFESYLNAPLREYKGDSGQHFESERNYSREELDALLDDINNCDF